MAGKTYHCQVLTPERAVLDTDASFAAVPAHDGEIGILRDRAPLLCRLGVGVMRLETPAGEQHLFIDAGFAEMRDNHLTILTEQACAPDAVDTAAEQAALDQARLRRATSPDELARKQRDIARATAKLRLAGRR